MKRVGLVIAIAACSGKPPAHPAPVGDPFTAERSDETPVLRRELEAEVLESYERDDTASGDDWQGVLDPSLGVVRFGVGPKDEQVITRGAPAPRALPLGLHPGADDADNPACGETLRSKHLEIQLSDDASTAWIADELSACVSVCGKQAMLPLRLTAVYVRGGDRWVLAVEHLSYPQTAASLIARGEQAARPIDRAVSARQWGDQLERGVAGAISDVAPGDRARVFATGPGTLAWWPDPAHELREGAIVAGPSLTDAFDAASITVENARIGVGPTTGGAGAIAWWAGTIVVHARRDAAGNAAAEVPVRLRATFVLRRDQEHWQIVQSHVSAPIDDATIAKQLAGDATLAGGRVSITCDAAPTAARTAAGRAPTAPEAARRSPPAAGSR